MPHEQMYAYARFDTCCGWSRPDYFVTIICSLFTLITQREAIASPSTWRDFKAHFDGFHAAGHNSAESEPILVKFGTL